MENNKNLETHNENFRTLKRGYFEKYPLLNKIKKGSFLKKLPFKPYRLDAVGRHLSYTKNLMINQ